MDSPHKGPLMRNFAVPFNVSMGKLSCKQSNCWWFNTPSHSCDVTVMAHKICWSMMTSSNGNIFRVTGPLCGEFTGPGEFPAQRPVTRSFDVFFDLRPNKRLSKQPWDWWFETPRWSLWRHCNGNCFKAGIPTSPHMTQSKRHYHVETTSFWRNDIIITPCVRYDDVFIKHLLHWLNSV